jgi:hypothetical protein
MDIAEDKCLALSNMPLIMEDPRMTPRKKVCNVIEMFAFVSARLTKF